MISNFKGKTAVLTGAGSGFGLECARIGARLGMNLVLVDVQQDALDARRRRDDGRRAPRCWRARSMCPAPSRWRPGRRGAGRFGAPHFVFNNAGVGAGGLVWENSVRLGMGAGREPVGRDPRRAPVHAHDAGGRGQRPGATVATSSTPPAWPACWRRPTWASTTSASTPW
jgi:NAD(P)-dependent dehydrogenase (short-subunit alcohol dehydrogenase family)